MDVSAACYRSSEDIGVVTVVVTEFEFGHVQRKMPVSFRDHFDKLLHAKGIAPFRYH